MLDTDDLLGTLDTTQSVRCSLTDDQVLSGLDQQDRDVQKILDYLNQDPRNAIVVTGFTEDNEYVAIEPTYVLRGASECDDNFYTGPFPAVDPGDANGGDWFADEALARVING